jgi:uncharacterized protein YndB with AHSA1/START domain
MNEASAGITGDVLQMERTLDASPERIFDAWTRPALLAQWWGPPGSVVTLAEMDVRVGGRYRLGIQRGPAAYVVGGVFQVIQPPHQLAFTWRWENAEMDIGESLVTIELRANGRQTDLRLTHAQLPNAAARAAHGEGWEGILASLDQFIAG